MSGLGRIHKWARNHSIGQQFKRKILGDDTYDQLHPMGTQAMQAYDATQAAQKPVEVIPLPDEDNIARLRRRRAASRTGGRDSTILTDTFGP